MSRNVISMGSRGPDVELLQIKLAAHGYAPGEADGIFGEKTLAALLAYQADNGLAADGVAGEKTWEILMEGRGGDTVLDFIRWALTHVKRESIPDGAVLLLPVDDCGAEPWEYLYGTSGRVCTQSLLNDKYADPYKGWGWSRDLYDRATAGWVERGQIVADCQGLLDAYCTKVLGVKTDVNAHGCYAQWCEDRGRMQDISRAYVIGEAVFRANDYGTMKHVGWICGFALDGEPLVIEERGLSYGCVVTRLSGRGWTHRGLMTKRFIYELPDATEGVRYAVCTGGSVNVRYGPSTEYDIGAVAHAGDLLLAQPAFNGWRLVAAAIGDDIVKGYMSAKYVREV